MLCHLHMVCCAQSLMLNWRPRQTSHVLPQCSCPVGVSRYTIWSLQLDGEWGRGEELSSYGLLDAIVYTVWKRLCMLSLKQSLLRDLCHGCSEET